MEEKGKIYVGEVIGLNASIFVLMARKRWCRHFQSAEPTWGYVGLFLSLNVILAFINVQYGCFG